MAQSDWAFSALPDENIVTDPTRMAHGVLTGIGFLCAGVIFRTGFSIHGLTTAASLWITSAIGILFGAGLYGLGALGTGVTALVLVGLRLINNRLPARTTIDLEVSWSRASASPEVAVEALILKLDPHARANRTELTKDGAWLRTWKVKAPSLQTAQTLARELGAIQAVAGFRLDPRDD
ncbi:hypothetical protein LTR94_024208 [Friedmanniomyces endolithicus]|nr:hypothetical protein LTR94_024208 [Friedmanniomyces endolithicus]